MNLALDAARTRPAALVATAGWAAVATVGVAGLTAGFFAWYGYLLRGPHAPLTLEASLAVALVAGPAIALLLWSRYARYLHARADVPLGLALKLDAWTWAPLVLLWTAFLAPSGVNATGRAVALAVGLAGLAKVVVAAQLNATVRDVATTFVVTRVPIIVIAELAAVLIGQRAGQHYTASTNPLLAVWARWDAEHYLRIVTEGYSGTEPAFFPLYPALIKIVGAFTGSHLIAGLLVSNVASFFALLYLYKLVEHQYNRHVAHRAIFYVSIFPTAIFFSAVYTEALFLALTVASFYYIRERRWVTAGIIGAFASAARVEGVLLAVPFLIEWFVAIGGEGRSIDARLRDLFHRPVDHFFKPLLGLALIPAGLLAYMAYLWVITGDPMYFSHVQSHWGRHLAPPWVAFAHSFNLITHAHAPQTVANQILEVAFTLLMLVTTIVGARRLRASYTAYSAVSILVPMSTASLMSMPRFALVLFPMFALLGLWGERPAVANAIVAFSLPLLGLFTVLFADWYWVA